MTFDTYYTICSVECERYCLKKFLLFLDFEWNDECISSAMMPNDY